MVRLFDTLAHFLLHRGFFPVFSLFRELHFYFAALSRRLVHLLTEAKLKIELTQMIGKKCIFIHPRSCP
jgi:hypothetical protein